MARQESIAKAGYYPTPFGLNNPNNPADRPSLDGDLTYVKAIARMLIPHEQRVRMLDMSAGEGDALKFFSEEWNAEPFAIELERNRALACKSYFGSENVINDTAFNVIITPRQAFPLIWNNAPYLDDVVRDEVGDKDRLEYQFLMHNREYLSRDNGIMVNVVYAQHVNAKYASYLYRYFTDVQVYRIPQVHLSAYMQLVIFTRLNGEKRQEGTIDLARALEARASRNYQYNREMVQRRLTEVAESELFPSIVDAEPLNWRVGNPVPTKTWKFLPIKITQDMRLDSVAIYNPLGEKQMGWFEPKPAMTKSESLMKPKRLQMAGLMAAGLLNGATIQTARGLCVVGSKVVFVNHIVEEEDIIADDGEVEGSKTTLRRVPELTMVTVYEDGSIERLTDEEQINEFIIENMQAIIKYVDENFEVLYNFDFIDGRLKPILDGIRLRKGAQHHKMNQVQKHVSAAAVRRLMGAKGVIIAGEPGIGKTLMSAAIMQALTYREHSDPDWENVSRLFKRQERVKPDQFHMVVCPPHMVKKWANELKAVNPDAFIYTISSGEGSIPINEVAEFVKEIDKLPATTLKIMVISHEMYKVGDGKEAAFGITTRRGLRMGIAPRRVAETGNYVSTTRRKDTKYNRDRIETQDWLIDPVTGFPILQKYTRDMEKWKSVMPQTLRNKRMSYGLNRNATIPRNARRQRWAHGEHLWKKYHEELAEYIKTVKLNYSDERGEQMITRRNHEFRIALFKSISDSRSSFDQFNANEYGALWMEARTFSGLKSTIGMSAGEMLRRARKLPERLLKRPAGEDKNAEVDRYPIVPLPDLMIENREVIEQLVKDDIANDTKAGKTRRGKYLKAAEEAGRDLWIPHKNPRASLEGVAGYIADKLGDRLHTVFFDEFHEYKGWDAARGQAMTRLANAATKVVGLTGTLYGGVASSVYMLEFVMSEEVRNRYPWTNQGMMNWIETMGILEREVRERRVVKDGVYSMKRDASSPQEVPGASPLLLATLINHTIFVTIQDTGVKMPPKYDIPVAVPMDAVLEAVYQQMKMKVKNYQAERILKRDNSFTGAYFHSLLDYPNTPHADYQVWHRMKHVDPETEEVTMFQNLVCEVPALPQEYVTSKERKLIEIVKEELAEDRGVGIFVSQTGARDIQNRITWLLDTFVPESKYAVLRSKSVSTSKREEWIKEKVDAGTNILICNPENVKTGLDLIEFPTLIFYEVAYSLYTADQAAQRAWRIIQTKPCKVYHLFYEGEMEHKGVELVAQKRAAARFLYGQTGGSMTAMMSGGSNSLMKALSDGLEDAKDVRTLSEMFNQSMKVEQDERWSAVTEAEQVVEQAIQESQPAKKEEAARRKAAFVYKSVQVTGRDGRQYVQASMF